VFNADGVAVIVCNECGMTHWKTLSAAVLARMLRSGLGRVGSPPVDVHIRV